MPRLGTDDMETHKASGNFSFTGARIANLGATEYTLATAAFDITGSMDGHGDALRDMMVTIMQSCQKSPRSDNLLLRALLFNSSKGVVEIHGFLPLADIDPAIYKVPTCYGATNLYDAAYNAIGATNTFGEKLDAQDYLANAVTFIVTDGEDNVSTVTPDMVGAEVKKAVSGEHLESHLTILIGMTSSSQSKAMLNTFKQRAGLSQFIDAGDVTKGKLAKLADFVSQSISSTSQALGTGGPSQSIAATI